MSEFQSLNAILPSKFRCLFHCNIKMLFHSCFSGKLQNEISNCILVVKYLQDCPLLVISCSPFFFPLNSLFRVSFAFPYCLYSGFPGGSDGKASTCNAGDLSSIPGLGRSPGEGKASRSNILAWRIPWTVALSGSSVHGVLQATILEWVAISFSRGSSQLRD